MSDFVDTIPGAGRMVHDILRARREGKLPKRFTSAELKKACPRWIRSIPQFLSKHRRGNRRGDTERFIKHGDGTWSLIGECRSRPRR